MALGRKTGGLLAKPLDARYTISDSGCWLWLGAKLSCGYGNIEKKKYGTSLAHRAIYEHVRGKKLDRSVELDHICANKACVNPEHLRECSKSENMCYRPTQANNTSGFKGVCWNKQCGKWMAKIILKRKQIHLGLFVSKEMAARAYNEAALIYHGEFAWLNNV